MNPKKLLNVAFETSAGRAKNIWSDFLFKRTQRGLVITVLKQSEQRRGEAHNPQNKKGKRKRKQRAHMSARAPTAFASLKVSVLSEHLVSTGGVDVHLLLCLNIMNILLFN